MHCYNELNKNLQKAGLILMNTSILEEVNEVADGTGHAEVHSIYNAMQQLQDRRRKQGKRYPVELVLTYLLLAKAAGETTLQNDFLCRALDWDCPGMRAFVAGYASPWSVPRRWCMASRV
jgi:hypothetical protein